MLGIRRDPLDFVLSSQIVVVGRCVGYVVVSWEVGVQIGEELVDIVWHGYVDMALGVVPFEGDSAV